MAISPMMSFLPSLLTTIGPPGVGTLISIEPSMTMSPARRRS
jgi:hypothetical protein